MADIDLTVVTVVSSCVAAALVTVVVSFRIAARDAKAVIDRGIKKLNDTLDRQARELGEPPCPTSLDRF